VPYLNVDLNFREHPKTKRLAGLLGPGSESLPLWLWLYVGRIHPGTGRLEGYEDAEIEAIVGWSGTAGDFVKAMKKVEWLEPLKDRTGYKIPDWLEHQGHLVAFKKRGKKAAKARWSKACLKHNSSNAQAMQTAEPSNAPTNYTVPTKLNQTTPTNPPQGFPADESQARDSAAFVGVPPEFAVKVWLETAARGWRDRQGQPISDWRRYLKGCHLRMSDWEARNGKPDAPKTYRRDPAKEADFIDHTIPVTPV